jgi:TATA-box binding protein (TBP) (component of TFIID and TFIIIB)
MKKDFNSIPVSTKTIIVSTNLDLDINSLYEKLPISDYTIIPKKRGRRRGGVVANPNENLSPGSIITLKFQGNCRGVDLKKKKKEIQSKKYFRNALTVVMKIENKVASGVFEHKLINFKISKNGKFQITGAKNDENAKDCLGFFWKYILNFKEFENVPELNIFCTNVMTNIDFPLGFLVDRQKLDIYLNEESDYKSLLETSFGYTGVNIKIPLKNLDGYKIINHCFDRDGNFKTKYIDFADHYLTLDPMAQKKYDDKVSYITFLVFQSGNVIMSGMAKELMESYYNDFWNIIDECKDIIIERLD